MIKVENGTAELRGSILEISSDMVVLFTAILKMDTPFPLLSVLGFFLDDGSEVVTEEQRTKFKMALAVASQMSTRRKDDDAGRPE